MIGCWYMVIFPVGCFSFDGDSFLYLILSPIFGVRIHVCITTYKIAGLHSWVVDLSWGKSLEQWRLCQFPVDAIYIEEELQVREALPTIQGNWTFWLQSVRGLPRTLSSVCVILYGTVMQTQ